MGGIGGVRALDPGEGPVVDSSLLLHSSLLASFLAAASSLPRWYLLSPPCQRLVQIPWLRGRGHPRYLAQALGWGWGPSSPELQLRWNYGARLGVKGMGAFLCFILHSNSTVKMGNLRECRGRHWSSFRSHTSCHHMTLVEARTRRGQVA